MRRPRLALLVMAAGLALLSIAAVLLVRERILEPGDAPLPTDLAGLTLQRAVYGRQAVAELTRLHGRSFPLTAGAVGMYGPSGNSTLWVSEAPGGAAAAALVWSMERSIAETQTPFTPVEDRTTPEGEIHVLAGFGQTHHYFRLGSRVLWLAADPNLAEAALQDTMEYYR
ncbi:MAG: hypothetical protein AB1449_06805 [Chloroflexota bacterium]